MATPAPPAFSSFLLLLFFGTICNAMIIPYMAFFIVEGLGKEPWIISLYAVLAIGLTVTANRKFAQRIDGGAKVFPLAGIAVAGYVVACIALSVSPQLFVVFTLGVLGFGISSSAVSTMFSLGGRMAERSGIPRERSNAYMRATTSTAWMIGPALTFLIADQLGPTSVFPIALLCSIIWVGLWWFTLPRDLTAEPKPIPHASGEPHASSTQLRLAAAFVFCLSFAHSLTFTSLPLFFVKEVGLPGYAPGIAFSVKTFVEVVAIFATPFLIRRFGMRKSLLATTGLAVLAIQVLAAVQSFTDLLVGAALEGLYYGLYASLGISYVQSFAKHRPAQATATYWNTIMLSGLFAGPAVGFIAQAYSFQTVVYVASGVAFCSGALLVANRKATNLSDLG